MAELGFAHSMKWSARSTVSTAQSHRPLESARPRFLAICSTTPKWDRCALSMRTQNHHIDEILDRKLIELASPLGNRKPVRSICRSATQPSAGAMLSGEIAKTLRPCRAGRRHDPYQAYWHDRAGFRCLGCHAGVTMELKAKPTIMSARASLAASSSSIRREAKQITPEQSIIVGNTVLYGAVEGECYFRGVAGERFACAIQAPLPSSKVSAIMAANI